MICADELYAALGTAGPTSIQPIVDVLSSASLDTAVHIVSCLLMLVAENGAHKQREPNLEPNWARSFVADETGKVAVAGTTAFTDLLRLVVIGSRAASEPDELVFITRTMSRIAGAVLPARSPEFVSRGWLKRFGNGHPTAPHICTAVSGNIFA